MSIRIGIGPGTDGPLAPGDYWRWVDACEEGGVDSIWHSDQLLGATMEPVAMLAALSARTSRMRFGTNAIVMAFRDPVVLAKQLATIDFMSDGRLLPVFGVGNAHDPYWSATGADARERGARANEAITLVRLLLEEEQVEFVGAHFRYVGAGVSPRPAKKIPLWTGGHSSAAIRRTARLGDGWLGGLVAPCIAGETKRSIEVMLGENGRTIDSDHYGVTLPFRIGSEGDPAVAAARASLVGRVPAAECGVPDDSLAVGTADEVITVLQRYVAAGMSKFVAVPVIDNATDLVAQTQLLIRCVLPEIQA